VLAYFSSPHATLMVVSSPATRCYAASTSQCMHRKQRTKPPTTTGQGRPPYKQASAHTNAADPQLAWLHKALAHKCQPCCSEKHARRGQAAPPHAKTRKINRKMQLQHLQTSRQQHVVQTNTTTGTNVLTEGAPACRNTPGPTRPASTPGKH
jgi:hypothetical protein